MEIKLIIDVPQQLLEVLNSIAKSLSNDSVSAIPVQDTPPVPVISQAQLTPQPLQAQVAQQVMPPAPILQVQNVPQDIAQSTSTQVHQPTPAASVPQVPTSAVTYDISQLSLAATQLVDADRRAELLNILAAFNVQSLMELPKDQYGAFANALRGLGVSI